MNAAFEIPKNGMLCTPIDDPDGKFFLKASGETIYQEDFLQTALYHYCLLYLFEQHIDIGQMLDDIGNNPTYKPTSMDDPAAAGRITVYRYILQRTGCNQRVFHDHELMARFMKNEYRTQRIMEAALPKAEFAIWQYFNKK